MDAATGGWKFDWGWGDYGGVQLFDGDATALLTSAGVFNLSGRLIARWSIEPPSVGVIGAGRRIVGGNSGNVPRL